MHAAHAFHADIALHKMPSTQYKKITETKERMFFLRRVSSGVTSSQRFSI